MSKHEQIVATTIYFTTERLNKLRLLVKSLRLFYILLLHYRPFCVCNDNRDRNIYYRQAEAGGQVDVRRIALILRNYTRSLSLRFDVNCCLSAELPCYFANHGRPFDVCYPSRREIFLRRTKTGKKSPRVSDSSPGRYDWNRANWKYDSTHRR